MNKLPTVSIVIPAYNHAGYLREAIESVLAQDYPAVELIVLDDGSTDETPDLLAELSGRGFYWESQPNIGQARTLNKGWQFSRGEILGYLSADDVLAPRAVSAAVKMLQTQPEIVATYSDFHLISPQSRILRRVKTEEYDRLRLTVGLACLPGPGAFFRRAAFELAGGWNPMYRQMPDLEFWLRLSLQGHFRRIPETLASFRVHNDSQTFVRANSERADEPCHMVRDFLLQSNLPPEVAARRNEMLAHSELLSAQYHAGAGRWLLALHKLGKAAWHSPQRAVRLATLHMALRACLHRTVYSWWFRCARRRDKSAASSRPRPSSVQATSRR